MAEPVFKLLRCDPEASHMLGWAKKEVRRLVNYASLDAFNRTWRFGDVSVRAQYFGGVARLWLEAEATERMAVWVTLPNPVPYRRAQIGRTQLPFQFSGMEYHTPWGLIAEDNQVLISSTCITYTVGSQDLVSSSDPNAGVLLWYQQFPKDYKVWAGGPKVDAYTITFPYGPYTEPMHAYPTHINIGSIPKDVMSAKYPTVWPGDYSFWGVTYPGVLAFPNFAEEAETKIAWTTRVSEEGKVGAERFHSWENDVSDSVVAGLRSGVFSLPFNASSLGKNPVAGRLPLDFSYTLRNIAPHSGGVYRELKCQEPEIQDTVQPVVNEQITINGFPIAQTVRRTDRKAVFRYERRTESGGIEEIAEEVSGSCTITSYGNEVVLVGTVEYQDWYCSEATLQYQLDAAWSATNDHDRPRIPHEAVVGGSWRDRGFVWNGAINNSILSGAGGRVGIYAPDTYFQTAQYASSVYELHQMFMLEHGEGYYYEDGQVKIATPVKIVNTLVATIPAPVKSWHENNKPKYKKGAGELYMYADFDVNSTVTIVPLFRALEEGASGMFDLHDQARSTGVAFEIYGSAVYKYDTDINDFVFSKWKPLPEGKEYVRVGGQDTRNVLFNAIVIYGGIKWDDVKEDARAQRKALADPNDPAHDPLMKAVLDALTPQE